MQDDSKEADHSSSRHATSVPSASPRAAASAPARKKPTAASRRGNDTKTAAADLFDIDSSFEPMDTTPPEPSPTARNHRSAASSVLTTASATGNRPTGTLGVRSSYAKSSAASKPTQPPKQPLSLVSSKLARRPPPRAPASPPAASTARPLPNAARLGRTLSSPAKLTTVQKRRSDGSKQKQNDSDDDDEFDLLREMRMRDPTRSASSIIAAAGRVRRALTAIESAESATSPAGKAVQSSHSSPLPAVPSHSSTAAASAWDFSSSASIIAAVKHSASSPTSAHQFSKALSGSDRQLMESLMYTLDGCSSTNHSVRHSSARSLLQQFQQAQHAGDDRGNALLFLMRAHGGFEQLCSAFSRWVADDQFMVEVFVACLFFLSKEKGNAQCITKEGIDILMAALGGNRDIKPITATDSNQSSAASSQSQETEQARKRSLRMSRSSRFAVHVRSEWWSRPQTIFVLCS